MPRGKKKKERQEAAETSHAAPHIQRQRWEKEAWDPHACRWRPLNDEKKPEPKRSHIDGPKERPMPEHPDRGRNSEKHEKVPIEPPPRIRKGPQPGDVLAPRATLYHPDGYEHENKRYLFSYISWMGAVWYYKVMFEKTSEMIYLGGKEIPECYEHSLLYKGSRITFVGSGGPGQIWDYFDPIKRAK